MKYSLQGRVRHHFLRENQDRTGRPSKLRLIYVKQFCRQQCVMTLSNSWNFRISITEYLFHLIHSNIPEIYIIIHLYMAAIGVFPPSWQAPQLRTTPASQIHAPCLS